MNLLADESVDRQLVEQLRQDGHSVLYVAEMSPSVSDEVVLAQANANQAVLLTADKDFGELVYRDGRMHAGVVLIRLGGLSASAKARVVSAHVQQCADKMIHGFTVLTPTKVRIRHRL